MYSLNHVVGGQDEQDRIERPKLSELHDSMPLIAYAIPNRNYGED